MGRHRGGEPTPPPESYGALLAELEQRVHRTRAKAAMAVNRKLVLLYWSIGRDLLGRQGTEDVDRLAADLRRRIPGMAGLSPQTLRHMRAFAEAWPDLRFVQQVLILLPWGHNTCLLDKLATREAREWYACQAVQHGWSRDVLSRQIASDLLGRQGGVAASPPRALPAPELSEHVIDDPFSLDVLAPGRGGPDRDAP
jgi:predicted nuclease of restriction endonuclease-like (RecB) superfamily